MNTIGAENTSEEEVAPGQVAVTGQGGGGGKTATMFGPEGEASVRETDCRSLVIHPFSKCSLDGYTLRPVGSAAG